MRNPTRTHAIKSTFWLPNFCEYNKKINDLRIVFFFFSIQSIYDYRNGYENFFFSTFSIEFNNPRGSFNQTVFSGGIFVFENI